MDITFKKFPDEKPGHMERILRFVDTDLGFGYYGYEPIYDELEIAWEVVDSDGNPTGCSITTEDEDRNFNLTPPELSEEEIEFGYSCKLVYLSNKGGILDDTTFYWCNADYLYDKLED